MSKKLLSEAQVRKFMGLANLDANISSNFLTEMYGIEEEEIEMDAEEAPMPEEEPDSTRDGCGTRRGCTRGNRRIRCRC